MSEWQWWQDRRAGKLVPNDGHPKAGFFRKPSKEFYGARKTFTPVAYWWDPNEDEDGESLGPPILRCREGDKDVSEQRGLELWQWVVDHDVSEEAYREVAQYGGTWPDEHELVPMGDNLPPEDTSFEGLRDAIEPLSVEAKNRLGGLPIADQDEADRIANLADRLAELCKKAEEQRKLERKPFDDELKRIQRRWLPIIDLAEVYKTLKYKLLTPWQVAQDKAQKEEAEAAAAAGEPAAAETRRPRAGTRGRAMTLKSIKKAHITDYAACLEFFKESDDIRSCVQMLANRAVRAGIAVPGAEVIEEQQTV